MPPGTRGRTPAASAPSSNNTFYGYPADTDTTGLDWELLKGLAAGTAKANYENVKAPFVMTADAYRSLRDRQPKGVYKDLYDAARYVASNPQQVPTMVRNALKDQADRATSSPRAMGEVIGEQIDLLGPAKRFMEPIKSKIFTGPRSATWDANRAAQYERLEPGALDTEQQRLAAWQQTGTYRGPDGNLRQEIDDSVSRITPNAASMIGNTAFVMPIENLIDHPEVFAAYPQLRGIQIHYDPSKPKGGAAHPHQPRIDINGYGTPEEVRSVLLHEIQHAVQQLEHNAPGGSPLSSNAQANLANIIDGANLPQFPPAIANAKTQLQQVEQQIQNAMNAPWNAGIAQLMNEVRVTPTSFATAMTGPAGQVWKTQGPDIMKIVGQPPNASRFPGMYHRWAMKAATQVQRRLQGANAPSLQNLRNQQAALTSHIDNLINTTPGARNTLLELQAYKNRVNNLNTMPPHLSYMYLGGEGESRAVQARMLMDLQQRRNTHPLQSYDVPYRETYNLPYADFYLMNNMPITPPGKFPWMP